MTWHRVHRVLSIVCFHTRPQFSAEREREHLIYDNRHRVRRMHGGIDRWNGWFEFQEYRGEYDFTDRMRLSVIPLTTTTSLVTVELQFLRWNYSLSLFLSFSFSLEWNVQFSSDGSIVLVTFSYWWQCWFDKFKEYIILVCKWYISLNKYGWKYVYFIKGWKSRSNFFFVWTIW